MGDTILDSPVIEKSNLQKHLRLYAWTAIACDDWVQVLVVMQIVKYI